MVHCNQSDDGDLQFERPTLKSETGQMNGIMMNSESQKKQELSNP